MPKKEAPIDHLQRFLPPGTYEAVLQYLQFYKVHLTVAAERKSILGDYRHRTHFSNHRISVNGNLNKFSFLITLLHELAHLLTFELLDSLKNPAATSCAEDGLIRVLRKYDDKSSHHRLVEEIPENGIFRCDDGRVFKRGEKMRKRFKCIEVNTGRVYLFSPVYEVELSEN